MRKFIKSFFKPVLAAVLVATMALSVVPVFSFAAFAETEGIFNYEVQDGKVTITGLEDGSYSGDINVPSTIGGYPVISIGGNAFSYCTGLTSVTIPYSVTQIYWEAFYGCTNLQTIYYMGTEAEFAKVYLEDDWSGYDIIYHNHSYKSTVTKATLTKNGKIIKKCAECGKTVSTVLYYPKTVSLSKTSYDYSGKVITPGVTVKSSKGKALKKGTDYTVSYSSGRKKVGNYSATVNFKGNYTGKKTLKFKIMPKVTLSSAELCVGQTKNIGAKSSNKITYKSSNSKVVSVNSKGVITAIKKGSATITVTSNKLSKTVKVKVSNPYINLNKAKISISRGKSETLKATLMPSSTKVTWSSANSKIAKVSAKGKVTGVKIGSTTIKATFKYKGKTYQKTCKVTVKKPSAEDVANDQAVKKAKEYLSIMAFSRSGLISQLEFEGFTASQATYGADHSGANWKKQAAKKAKEYLNIMAFSRSGLISQLEFEGFTSAEAVYGVTENGL